jgi:hypothetical protein
MIDSNSLMEYVVNNPNLVKMRECANYPGLFVLKYSKKVFYDNLWNNYLEECRGTIVDKDFTVMSRPFTKIYNYGIESQAPVLDDATPVTAYRKVNGFMVAVTVHRGKLLVSTTGTTDSEYVDMAKEMMEYHMPLDEWLQVLSNESNTGMTFMFECVHKNDPHIIPEKEGMHFLGWRVKAWEGTVHGYSKLTADLWRDFAVSELNCYTPECYFTTIGGLQQMAKTCQHEGFVFYTNDGISAKIKSPYYLTQKWLARNPSTDKIVDTKKDIKKNLDEEYYSLVDAIRENIEVYTALNEQDRLSWIRNYYNSEI